MKKTNFMVILLGVLLLAAVGYIVFDKCTRKEIKCTDCEKCNTQVVTPSCVVDPKESKEVHNTFTEEEKELKTCTIDMTGKKELNQKEICDEDFFLNNHREVLINNITYNGKTHTIRYYYNGLHEDPDEDFVKVYVDDYLSDIHKGTYQNSLSKIKITKDGKIQLTEYSFTDVPATTNTYYFVK